LKLGLVFGVAINFLFMWTSGLEFSFDSLVFCIVAATVLLLLLKLMDILFPTFVQVTDQAIRRFPIVGNPVQYLFEEMVSFSVRTIWAGEERIASSVEVSLRSNRVLVMILPAKMSEESLVEVLSGKLAQTESEERDVESPRNR